MICRLYIAILLIFLSVALASQTHAQPRKNAVRQDAELVVQTAAHGLGGILANVKNVEAQIQIVQDFVSSTRFFSDQSGYFFVYNYKGICVAHGDQPDLVGQTLKNHVDSNGIPVIQAMIDMSKRGGGFIEYVWQKPNTDGLYRKLGYIEPIANTDLFIGTGVYFPGSW